MSRYSNDPRWLTAKYAGVCAKTGERFAAGTQVFYFPRTKKCFAGAAAEQEARSFECTRQDDEYTSRCESMEAARNERDYQ